MDDNSEFIHFGCWGEENYPETMEPKPYINVIDDISNYVETSKRDIKFVTVAGDNYYPEKTGFSQKILNKDELHKIINKLNDIPNIKKYLLWGNHDILDATVDYRDIDRDIHRGKYRDIEVEFEAKQCDVLNEQIELIKKKKKENDTKIEYFLDVIVDNSFNNTSIIMIDTTLHSDKFKEEDEINSCYNIGIFNGTFLEKKTIRELREYQFNKIVEHLRKTDNKHIIFIGHHPIKSYRYHKKEEKRYGKEKNLIELFQNLIPDLLKKNIFYLCADTHIFQESILFINNKDNININITQYIVGTGGAELDDCDENVDVLDLNDDICNDLFYNKQMIVMKQQKSYGYLICKYNSNMDMWFFKFKDVISYLGGNYKNKKLKKSKTKKYKIKKKYTKRKQKYNRN
jgi:hypothetical protein